MKAYKPPKEYKPLARWTTEPRSVFLDVTVLELSAPNTLLGVMHMDLILKCTWDENLSRYEKVHELPMNPEGILSYQTLTNAYGKHSIWFPDVAIINKATGAAGMSEEVMVHDMDPKTGRCRYNLRLMGDITLDWDLHPFPFDVCDDAHILIEGRSQTIKELNFVWENLETNSGGTGIGAIKGDDNVVEWVPGINEKLKDWGIEECTYNVHALEYDVGTFSAAFLRFKLRRWVRISISIHFRS
jgi:hypothetical protein